ncbi:MAG: hypothetical protein IJY89_02260, partial [Clostridia bacterium]|nr:hypothetical protein [Clostridia bacterium]
DVKLTGSSNVKVNWQMTEKSTPQLSYKVVVTDGEGKELLTKSGSRPEVSDLDLGDLGTDNFKCTVTVTDVFGKTTEKTVLSENYKEGPADPSKESESPSASVSVPEPQESKPADNDPSEKNDSVPVVIGIVCGVIVAVAAAVGVIVAVVVTKRKKKA